MLKTPEEIGDFAAWQAFFTRKTYKIMLTEVQLAGWMTAAVIADRHQYDTVKEEG